MKLSRRNFLLKSGAVALAATAVAPITQTLGQSRGTRDLFNGPLSPSTDPFSSLTQQHFVPFIGEVMNVKGSNGRTVQVRLTEVNGLTRALNENSGYTGESFSLIFEGTRKSRMAGDLYQFDHYALGQFSMLLVPVGRLMSKYEAIVNRISR